MALTLKDLMNNPHLIETIRPPIDSYPSCSYCGERIFVHPDLLEDHTIEGKPAHRGCDLLWELEQRGISL